MSYFKRDLGPDLTALLTVSHILGQSSDTWWRWQSACTLDSSKYQACWLLTRLVKLYFWLNYLNSLFLLFFDPYLIQIFRVQKLWIGQMWFCCQIDADYLKFSTSETFVGYMAGMCNFSEHRSYQTIQISFKVKWNSQYTVA